MIRLLIAAVIVGALQVCGPAGAGADDRGLANRADAEWARDVSPARRARALRLYRRGNDQFAQQKYARAAELYTAALDFWDHPAIRYNLAVSQLALGQTVEAFTNLRLGMAYGPAPLGQQLHRRGLGLLELLQSELIELTLSCTVRGSRLSLDGRALGTCPGRFAESVEAGRHVVVAEKSGFPTARETLVLAGGTRRALALDVRAMRLGVDAIFGFPLLAIDQGFGVGFGALGRVERRFPGNIAITGRAGFLYRRPRYDRDPMLHVPFFAGIVRSWDTESPRPFVSVELGAEVDRGNGSNDDISVGIAGNLGAGLVFGNLELRASLWLSRAFADLALVSGSVGYNFSAM